MTAWMAGTSPAMTTVAGPGILLLLHMILLHGFIKKTQKTPKADIDLALKRMKEVT